MESYSIWEVIKMLSENNGLKFKSRDVTLDIDRDNYLRIVCSNHRQFNGNIELRSKWELVQQPVPVMEAIEAYDNGKTIRCVDIGSTTIYKHNSKGLNRLKDKNGCAIESSELLRGRWFIQEDEEE